MAAHAGGLRAFAQSLKQDEFESLHKHFTSRLQSEATAAALADEVRTHCRHYPTRPLLLIFHFSLSLSFPCLACDLCVCCVVCVKARGVSLTASCHALHMCVRMHPSETFFR